MPDWSDLFQRIGYHFTDEALPRTALTHRSFSSNNNERLEFLGDSILGLIISDELYRKFPNADEGQLSRTRASLVKGETLSRISQSLQLGIWLQLGSGELKSGGRRRNSILADAYEALVGAIYLDGGVEVARKFVLECFKEHLASCRPEEIAKDPKTSLQELLQSRSLELPQYEVTAVEGLAHKQQFTVSCKVWLDGKALQVSGTGASRRKAEQEAASGMCGLLKSN